jgi:hypothetical protein
MAALAAALVLGCATRMQVGEGGRWVEIPPGSTLTLNAPVPVPQDRARVFFLDGRVRPSGASLGPSCGLEVRTIARDRDQEIQAGTYRIARVQRYWTEVAGRWPAAAPRLVPAQANDGGGSPMVQEGYHLWLESGPDPNVMRLTCLGMLDDLWRARPPTIDEIRSALGRVATLELAAPAS